MSQLASTRQEREEPPVRDGGDACPGALRLHVADDGALARIRIPAGLLSAAQAGALADLAERMGDGHIDITSRGNLQLRGLDEQQSQQLGAALGDLGLLPSPRHERVRNVVASPLSGLDDKGSADVRCWAARLDEMLCASEAAAQLSGRFLFALDDGRGDVAALDADVTLIALPGGEQALLRVGAEAEAVSVPAGEAAGSALLAAELFLTAVRESGEGAWRVRELPSEHSLSAGRLSQLLTTRGMTAQHVASPPPMPTGGAPAPGVVESEEGRSALSVMAPLGRLASSQWRRLADLAGQHGEGELRVTPWRGVVLPGLPRARAEESLRELDEAGLITHDGSPWLGVGACTGLPGCSRSHRDVRSDAAATAADTAANAGLLPVHWSGCERRCGHPQGDRVDVVAAEDGYTVAVHAEGSTRKRAVPDGELAHAVASARAERK
jgi:precorrin-3B synthase